MRTDSITSEFLEASPPTSVTRLPREGRRALQFLSMWVLTAVPALVATAHQYTWSLLMFTGPLVVLAPELRGRGVARPLLRAMLVLVPMGVVLTVLFADDFFTYANRSATLGLRVAAFDVTRPGATGTVPIEEFAFYALGFLDVLIVYSWADAVFVPRARPSVRAPIRVRAILTGVLVGGALAGSGVLLHDAVRSGGFPGYWVYLMVVPVPFVIASWPTVRSRINWGAMGLTAVTLWGQSIFWEISLAVPQGWWGYRAEAMLGLTVRAWGGFPVEGVLVWLLTPFATVFAFELMRNSEAHVWRRS